MLRRIPHKLESNCHLDMLVYPLNEKYPQRNVHFRDPEGEVGRKQYVGVHNPILITPRHPEHESSGGESEILKRMNSPDSPSDPNGSVFLRNC